MILINWHCLTSHCSQAGPRNDQNGPRLFIAASDRHQHHHAFPMCLNDWICTEHTCYALASLLPTVHWFPRSFKMSAPSNQVNGFRRSLRSDCFFTMRLHCLFWHDPTSFDDCPRPTISKYAFAQLEWVKQWHLLAYFPPPMQEANCDAQS